MKSIRRFIKFIFRNRAAALPDPEALSRWAIGRLDGSDLMSLHESPVVANPVFRASDVTDRRGSFVADPFIIKDGERWYLFFEFFDLDLNRGVIGYAESDDGKKWNYRQIILEEPFHLSYPHVFSHDGSYYMIPETKKAREVRLYKAVHFPDKWVYVKTILKGKFTDSSIFYDGNLWWLFTSKGAYSLALYYSKDLLGDWQRHRRRLIYFRDKTRARPGGRIVRHGTTLVRFSQDAKKHYGHQLRAFVIDKLTPTEYAEHEASRSPFITPASSGWNSVGTHTVDPLQLSDGSWIAIYDGTG